MRGTHLERITCHNVTNWLLAYVNEPPAHAEAKEMAISHLISCPHCQNKARFLLHALAVGEEDELTCDTCLAQLPAFVLAPGIAQDHQSQAAVTRHLTVCPPCALAYSELLALTDPDNISDSVNPAYNIKPDLSFLLGRRSILTSNGLGQLVIEFRQGLLQALNPPNLQAIQVTPLRDRHKKEIGHLSLGEVRGVQVEIAAYEEADIAARCQIVVTVNVRSRHWPDLAGLRVMIRGKSELRWSAETDAFGIAYFDGIPVDSLSQAVLQVEIREIKTDYQPG